MEREVRIKIYHEFLPSYEITLRIDSHLDEEEYIDCWIEDCLKNVRDWEFV